MDGDVVAGMGEHLQRCIREALEISQVGCQQSVDGTSDHQHRNRDFTQPVFDIKIMHGLHTIANVRLRDAHQLVNPRFEPGIRLDIVAEPGCLHLTLEVRAVARVALFETSVDVGHVGFARDATARDRCHEDEPR